MRLAALCTTLIFSISALAEDNFPYKDCFEHTAEDYGLDVTLLAAVASVESSLNPNAVSSSDALGLMQIKWPTTAQHLGITSRDQLFDPCTSITVGGKYLRELSDRFDYDITALAAYHAGPTSIDQNSSVPINTLSYIQKVFDEQRYIRSSKVFEEIRICKPLDLQTMANGINNPKERRNQAIRWINESGEVCSISELVYIRNRLATWLGTADGDGKVRTALDTVILSKSSETQKK